MCHLFEDIVKQLTIVNIVTGVLLGSEHGQVLDCC